MSSVVDERPVAGPPSSTSEVDASAYAGPVRLLTILAVAVVAGRVALPMLLDGPRLDETLTAWVVSDGLDDAVTRSWRFQGQSPVYFVLLWLWAQVAGTSIVALRIPSLIVMLAAGWQLRRLAGDLGLGPLRDLALAVFVVLSPVHVNAVTARPYALLLLTVIVATRAGRRWADSGRPADGVRWGVLCAGAVYFQPFAVYALAAQGWWLIVRRRAGASIRELVVPVVVAAVTLLPLVPQVLSLAQRQDSLAFVDVPSLDGFLLGLVPVSILLGLAAGALLSWPWAERAELRSTAPFVLAAAWFPQVGLFLQSHLTGNGVLVAKYLSPSAIGIALLAALVVRHFTSRFAVLVATALVVVLSVVPLEPGATHEWEHAVDFLETEHPNAEVLAMTGFIEAGDLTLFADAEARAYLGAPLDTQGLGREVHPLPLGLGPEAVAHVGELVEGLRAADEIAVVRAVAGVDHDRTAEEALARSGYREVARIEPLGLLVTVWQR